MYVKSINHDYILIMDLTAKIMLMMWINMVSLFRPPYCAFIIK
jgi:hypothetical protein